MEELELEVETLELEDIEVERDNAVEPIQVTINALEGGITATTMKLRGTLNKRAILILIDSGSTHSFLDAKLANDCKVPLVQITPVPVTVDCYS